MIRKILAVLLVASLTSPTIALRRTDRDDVQRRLEDGWAVAYGKEVDHGEYVLPDGGNGFGRDAVLKALRNPGQTFAAGPLELQGGIATYQHWTEERFYRIDPINGVFQRSSVKVARPHTHQSYIRWRRRSEYGSSDRPGRSSFVTVGSGTYDRRGGGICVKRERGREYTFREVGRTGDYLELTSVSGNQDDVRIYDDHVWHRQRDDRGNSCWRTSPNARGSWR